MLNEVINIKRQERYKNDPEFREKARKRSKERYERLKNDPDFKSKRNIKNAGWREENREAFREMQRKWEGENPFYYFLNNARKRAKDQGVPYDLKIADLRDLDMPEKCPYLGIPIRVGGPGGTENSPSLDKIIPSLGYVKGNVEFISSRANRLKNDATLEELEAIVNRLKTLVS
jgi:hypothetical protein